MTATALVEWWRDIHDPGINNIEIDPADNYWLAAHTKKFNGAWETTIVRWQYKIPSLIALIRNGKVIAGEELSRRAEMESMAKTYPREIEDLRERWTR